MARRLENHQPLDLAALHRFQVVDEELKVPGDLKAGIDQLRVASQVGCR